MASTPMASSYTNPSFVNFPIAVAIDAELATLIFRHAPKATSSLSRDAGGCADSFVLLALSLRGSGGMIVGCGAAWSWQSLLPRWAGLG